MKPRYLFIRLSLLFLVLAGLLCPAYAAAGEELSECGNPFIWVTLGNVRVKAEVAGTPEKIYLGLGGRPELAEGRGMLFIMPRREVQDFCMRDMRFALDFIWLGPGRVAGLTQNISPLDQEACYRSPEPVAFVLEVPAGFCERHGIRWEIRPAGSGRFLVCGFGSLFRSLCGDPGCRIISDNLFAFSADSFA